MSAAQAKASAALRIPQNLGAQQVSGQVGRQQNELSHNGIARASGDVKVGMVTGGTVVGTELGYATTHLLTAGRR